MFASGRNLVVLALIIGVTGGCEPDTFMIETRVRSDGTIERAICQPMASVSEAVSKHDGWQKTRIVDKPTGQTAVRELKPLAADGGNKDKAHFSAWGRFARAADIPDHFVLSASGLDRRGTLDRRYHRRDLGLVVEHTWSETLVDVVELDDRRRARDELVKLGIDMAAATLGHQFGKTYDFSSLEKWSRTNLAAFAADLLDYDLQVAIQRRGHDDRQLQSRIIIILSRYGLKITGTDGRLLKEWPKDVAEKFFIPFVRRLLKTHVRDSSGKPVGDEAIAEIVAFVNQESAPPAWQAVVKKRFGSEKAFDARTSQLATRIWGVYRPLFGMTLFGTSRQFDASMSLPGRVVETNGKITGEGTVVWNFAASEAFPLGYEMGCRSLETREQSAVLLAKLKPADRLGVLLKLVDLVDGDADPLTAVLRRCATKKSWAPLEVYRRGLDPKKQANEVKRLNRLYRLLELPLSGSGGAAT